MNRNDRALLGGVVVGCIFGFLIGSFLFMGIFSPLINYAYFFDDGEIRAIRFSKVGADKVYILPDEPNEILCRKLERYLEDKFGSGWSVEKVSARARIEKLVYWHSSVPDKKSN